MKMVPGSVFLVALFFTLDVTWGVSPLEAADLGQGCCSDLEERVAELEAVTARKGNRRVSLTLSGFVNEAVMFWDDGKMHNAYVVTNEDWQDRVRMVGEARIAPGWTAGYLVEFGVRGSHADRVTQFDPDGQPCPNCTAVRQSVWYIQNDNLGKIWVGQTGDAADCITEINLANTNYFSFSNAWGNIIGDGGSGFFLRRRDGVLTNLHWGQFVAQGVGQGIPGEGHRYNVVKYESPTVAGFTLSGSWGEDDLWNVALRYSGLWSGFRMAGGIAYTQNNDQTSMARRGVGNTNEVGLSASVMHQDTGLYTSVAWGRLHDAGLNGLYGRQVNEDTEFFTIQSGIERQYFSVGKTTIFGEYFQLDRGAGFVFGPNGTSSILNVSQLGTGLDEVASSQIRGWSVGVDQNVGEYVDLYLNYRWTQLDVITTNSAGTASAGTKTDAFQAMLAGAVVRF